MPRSTLMVDAWAWIALYNPADQYHDIARLANEELLAARYSLLTTNFILDEAYTALRQWGSPARAISFGRKIQAIAASGALEIVTITPEIEQAAWQLFERYDAVPRLSYTDCTTFAVMQKLGIITVFTGDEHFHILGFTIRP
jgi:predicted nucleic acid-binding protein